MTINLNVLAGLLNQYQEKLISKDQLSDWAFSALAYLLKGNAIDIDALVVYPFVSKLAVRSDSWESITEKEIYQFAKIIAGESNQSFTFSMKIPSNFEDTSASNILTVIKKYQLTGVLVKEEIEYLAKASNQADDFTISTLIDIFKIHISNLLSNYYFDEAEINFDAGNTIFIDENEVHERDIIERLIRLLNCAIGKDYFQISIVFRNGKYVFSVLI